MIIRVNLKCMCRSFDFVHTCVATVELHDSLGRSILLRENIELAGCESKLEGVDDLHAVQAFPTRAVAGAVFQTHQGHKGKLLKKMTCFHLKNAQKCKGGVEEAVSKGP